MAPLAGTSLRRKQSTCRVWRPALVVLPALLGAAVASPATIQSGGPGGVSMLFAARVATPIRLVVDPMVERVRSEVTIRIDARTRLASFEVLEEFRNNAGRVLEGDYLYAIPRGAVFHNLSLFAGENEMRGEMLQAEQARAIYEEIVRKRRDPALVELAGRDLIRARVFPIEPGDTRRIILRYAQVLPLLGDALRMQFPRTASVMDLRGDGPQGFPEPRADIRRATPTAPALASAVHVRIEHASMLGTPYSPTDAIDVVRRDGSLVEVRLLENERRPGRAAFELLLPRLGSTIGASLLAHAPDPGSEDGYFLLLLNPPAADTTETIARDVSLVLDVSGSMAGHKIEQARSALEQLLRGLRLHDRFRLITFSSAVRSYEPTYVSASPENIAVAIEYLRRVPADGSTNIDGALRAALEPQVAEGRLSMVLFLTDGLPTVGETDPVRISAAAEQLRDGERVFAFGVGDDVNTYLLDRLVEAGRGTVDYVRAGENVESAVAALGRRIGAPVLSDLRIVSAPATIEDLHPTPLPDLFHGQELVVTGRYRGGGVGSLVLEGERAGRRERFAFDVDFPHRQRANEYVARLWASRKVGALTAQLRLHGPDRELIEEIRTLEDHLRGCESCRSLIEDVAATRSLAAQLVGELAPEVDAPGWHEMLDRAGQSALQAPRSPRTWRRDFAWAATLVMAFGLGWQANREFAPGASNRPGEIRLAEPAQKQGAELTEGTLAPPTSAVGPAPDDRFERSSRVNEPAPSLAAVADEAADDIAAAQPARRAERAAAPEPLSAAARSVVGAEEGLRAAARPDESVSGEVRGGALVADLQERRLALADREEDRLAAGRLPAPPQAIASAGIARPPSEAEAAVAVRDFRASDELASRNELTASTELAAIDALAAEDWLGAPPLQLVGTGTVDVSVGPGGGLPDAARGRPLLRYRYVLEGGAQVTLLQQYVGSMADEAADLDVVDASEEFRQLEAPRRQGWRASSSLEDAVFSVHPDGDYMLRWQDRLGYLVWLRGDTDEASLRRLAAAVR